MIIIYTIQKNITRFFNLGSTYFLDPKELREVMSKLKKDEYKIYYPYKDSEKNIIYKGDIPKVLLYEIKTKTIIRHQDILGAMFSLNFSPLLFGDILIIDNHYYIYILDMLRDYFITNFLMVSNTKLILEEIDINTFSDYERSYEVLEFIVSSTRIDTVISSIMKCSRSHIHDMIKKKEIILNYDYLHNVDYKLKDDDIFSIKRIGKFKFSKIIKSTRKNNLIIQILKY